MATGDPQIWTGQIDDPNSGFNSQFINPDTAYRITEVRLSVGPTMSADINLRDLNGNGEYPRPLYSVSDDESLTDEPELLIDSDTGLEVEFSVDGSGLTGFYHISAVEA
jgi:hypothetical protein